MSIHAPKEKRTDTVEVECATVDSGDTDYEGQPVLSYTLAAVEAWCADLRRWGAGDDLVLPQANGLTVTLDVAPP